MALVWTPLRNNKRKELQNSVEHSSLGNTPILPIKKIKVGPDGKLVYRFIQDFGAINQIVEILSILTNFIQLLQDKGHRASLAELQLCEKESPWSKD